MNKKFRVWDKEKSYYLAQDNEFHFYQNDRISEWQCPISLAECLRDTNRYIVQQFTGLTDKNGREIYEGDVLKCKGYDGWFDGAGHYYESQVKYEVKESGESNLAGFLYIPKDCEVIGNIFELNKK